jgi:uncharacterized protein with PQ loop repeat
MNKKRIIIIGLSIAVIALLIFLFWDVIKMMFQKQKDNYFTEPVTTNNVNNGGGYVLPDSSGTPIIVLNDLKQGDLVKATQPLKVYKANPDWSASTAVTLATLAKGDFAGVVHAIKNNTVQLYYNNQQATVYKGGVKKM